MPSSSSGEEEGDEESAYFAVERSSARTMSSYNLLSKLTPSRSPHRILDSRRAGNGFEYKIKWEGYEEESWEPEVWTVHQIRLHAANEAQYLLFFF